MPRLGSLSSNLLSGIGITPPVAIVVENNNSFTGRIVAFGTVTSGTIADLSPSFAVSSVTTWTNATTTPSSFLSANAYNWAYNTQSASNGSIVMIINGYSGHTATTVDGRTWDSKARLSPNTNGSFVWCSLATGNGKWVTVWGGTTNSNSTTAAYSTDDGTSWNYVTIPSGKWCKVTFGNNRFVCVDVFTPGATIYSTDGINWNIGGSCPQGLPSPSNGAPFYFIGAPLNKFVSIRENADSANITTSSDGVTWSTPVAGPATGLTLFFTPYTAYGNGRLVMIQSYSNNSWYSDDFSASWTRVSTPFTAGYLAFTSLAYVNGVYVATARTASGQTAATWISVSGRSWTQGGTSTGISSGTGAVSYLNV